MEDASLEESILLALRRYPGCRAGDLAAAAGFPRTNFGRQLKNRVRQPLKRLLSAGLIEEKRGRYQLTEDGRKRLSGRSSGIS